MSFGQQLIYYAAYFLLTFLLISGSVTRIIKFLWKRAFDYSDDTVAVMTFVVANIVLFGLLLLGRNVGFTFEADDAILEVSLIVWLILDWTVLPRRTKGKKASQETTQQPPPAN